jgi:hypothetical protein
VTRKDVCLIELWVSEQQAEAEDEGTVEAEAAMVVVDQADTTEVEVVMEVDRQDDILIDQDVLITLDHHSQKDQDVPIVIDQDLDNLLLMVAQDQQEVNSMQNLKVEERKIR